MLKNVLRKVGKTLLILAMCAAVVVASYHIIQKHGDEAAAADAAAAKKQAATKRRIAVAITPVGRRAFERRVVVQGNVEAKRSALVSPRVGGTLEAIFVDEGDRVEAGKTRLFQTDALKLRQALEIRKGESAVARCTSREKEANLEKAQAQLDKAVLDEKRFKRLRDEKVVTVEDYERYASQLKQTSAMLKHGKSLVDLAVAQEQQAVHGVAMAEKDLRDALVVSPIDGVVSARYQEPGEMGAVGKPVVRIDDLTVLEVSAFLPAAHYQRIVPGKVKMRVRVGGVALGEPVVSYRSPTVDAKMRTFEVKCLLENPPDGVAPGAMAEIAVVLEHRDALGVPSEAVQQRGGRRVVFVLDGDKARVLPVTVGLDTDGWVELEGDGLKEGMQVVTMGQFLLNDGSDVAVQKGSE